MKKIVSAILLVGIIAFLAVQLLAQALTFETSEYAARRAKLMEQIPDGIVVIWGALRGHR